MTTSEKLYTLFKSDSSKEYIITTLKNEFLYKDNTDFVLSMMQYVSLYCIESSKGNVELAEKILSYINDAVLKPFTGTMTLTFGDVAESHVGMQQLGQMAKRGFNHKELIEAQQYFEERGCKTFLLHLNDFLPSSYADPKENEYLKVVKSAEDYQAWVLVARNAVNCLVGDDKGEDILTEMLLFKWDKKLFNTRQKKIQNKIARHNLNFSHEKQSPNFEEINKLVERKNSLPEGSDEYLEIKEILSKIEGKGTTIPFKEVPLLNDIRLKLVDAFGESARDLYAEGNLYYDRGNTGVNFHSDLERRKVIGLRLGAQMSMSWNWYYRNKPRGLNIQLQLQPGDIYCMSEKTVGTDGKYSSKYTLRHAAGAPSYTKTASKPAKSDKLHVRNQRPWTDNPEVTIGDVWFKQDKKKTWDEYGILSEC